PRGASLASHCHADPSEQRHRSGCPAVSDKMTGFLCPRMFFVSNSTIPSLLSALKPGQRYSHPRPPGSGDAWLSAELAHAAGRPLVLLCADPLEAQRLHDEILLLSPNLQVRQFPDWETLPYDGFSPHQDLISERLKTLSAFMQGKVDVLTVLVTTALYRLAPTAFLAAYSFSFRKGDKLDESALRDQLMLANYAHVSQVAAPGEFCIRGGLIDLFPMGSVLPYRIDLFDDEIESIRSFDMDTQRSLYPVNEVELLPGREFPMDDTARNHFRSRFRDLFEGDPSRATPYKDMGNGIAFAGIEYYLPLFFDDTATLFDYLRPDTITITIGTIEEAIRQFHDDTQSRYRFLKSDRERPVLPPEHLFLSEEQFFVHLKSFARLHLDENAPNAQFAPAPDIAVLRRSDDPFARLRAWLDRGEQRLLLCADSAGRRETLLQLLREQQLEPSAAFDNVQDFVASDIDFGIAIAPLNTGFIIGERQLCLVTENDLYPGSASVAQRRRKKQERSSNVDAMVRDLSELREGDPVVHMQYGIGRYHGLVTMDLGEGDIELLHLQYSGNSTLYVPVSQLHVISRYSGADP